MAIALLATLLCALFVLVSLYLNASEMYSALGSAEAISYDLIDLTTMVELGVCAVALVYIACKVHQIAKR